MWCGMVLGHRSMLRLGFRAIQGGFKLYECLVIWSCRLHINILILYTAEASVLAQ